MDIIELNCVVPAPSPLPASRDASTWLLPRGEMGAAIARHPWEKTPFGPLACWPVALRMTVNLMLEAGAAMAIVWGKDYRFLYNDRYREIIADKHPAALGAPGAQIFPESWLRLQPLFEQAYRGEAVVIEDIALTLDRAGVGSEGFFSGSYNPLRGEDGKIHGFLGVVVETTNRVAREKERAQIFDTTLSAISDFAYSFDRDGRFIYVNKALLDLWGLKLEQAVGKNFFDLKYPDDLAARLQRQIQEVIDGKRSIRDETPYQSPTGAGGYYEYIFSPVFGPDGSVTVVAGSTRDITDRKNLEARVHQTVAELETAKEKLERQAGDLETLVRERTAKLQDTVTELESFSYSISHDLRGPLRVMQSFAQALREDCGNEISPAARDYIRRIVAGAERMDRVIQDVLVYSRIARTELPLEPIGLDDFLASLLEGYPQFHAARADITIAGNLPTVLANRAALTQCTSNLVGNAIKFVAPGTRPVVKISARVADGRAFVSVADNGIGIPPEQHAAIFGVFYRLEQGYEGTGIGLAIVRKAVERMGGRVTVASKRGAGSTFTFDLALA